VSLDAEAAMRRAIALAWQGWGRVGTNPMVGAVLLRNGEPLFEGHHDAFGGPHAEVVALAAAGAAARGADLVVTLEPCTHHGKTPPCTAAIIEAGVRHVVFGARDPHTSAAGGAEALSRAGVVTEGGVLAADVRAQNATFFHRHECPDRPFVAVKLALSLDAKIADSARRSRWVTGPDARDYVQWLRAGYEAIAVGAGTARADDPQLTVRGALQPAVPPRRIVFDERGELPEHLELLRTAREVPTTVVTGTQAPAAAIARFESAGAGVVQAPDLAHALRALRAGGSASVLVEGGGVLAGRLLAAGLVDRLYLLQAPVLLGAGGVPGFAALPDEAVESAPRWRVAERRALGGDTLLVLDRS